MYNVQRGILPALTSIVSFALPIGVLILDLNFIFSDLNAPIPEILNKSNLPVWQTVALMLFFTMFFPVFLGMLFASIFPNIEIRRDGLSFRYWEFFSCRVKWAEIDSIVYYQNGYIVLRIDKRGLPVLNGLYFNNLQARILRSQLPVLILSPGLEKRKELIEEILRQSSPRIVQID